VQCLWSFDQSESWIHCLASVGVVAGGNRALIGYWRIAQLCQREGVLNRVIIVLIKEVFLLSLFLFGSKRVSGVYNPR